MLGVKEKFHLYFSFLQNCPYFMFDEWWLTQIQVKDCAYLYFTFTNWIAFTGCSLGTVYCNLPFDSYLILILALFLLFLSSMHREVFLLSGKTCQYSNHIVQKLRHLTDQILKICMIHRTWRVKLTLVLFCKYLHNQSLVS